MSKGMHVRLQYGIMLHEGERRYHNVRAEGQDHISALISGVRHLLEISEGFESDDTKRTRYTLLRTFIWNRERWKSDSLVTLRGSDGSACTEYMFSVPLPLETPDGDNYQLVGYWDRVAVSDGGVYIPDLKHTSNSINEYYGEKFDPDNQMNFYDLAGHLSFENFKGIVVDVVQTAVNFSRPMRAMLSISDERREEFLQETMQWIKIAERMAEEGYPANDKSCQIYGGCDFINVCRHAPSARAAYLAEDFVTRKWNPLEQR